MKKRIVGIITFIVILLFIVFFDRIINFTVNIKWFMEVGYLSVYLKRITATLELMIPLFIISYLGILIYYRSIRGSIIKWANISAIDPRSNKIEKIVFRICNLVISLFISYAVSSVYWYRILQFKDATSFNLKDPIFNLDISFFVFRLPLIESIYSAIMTLLVFLVIITLIAYFVVNTKDRIISGDFRRGIPKVRSMRRGITQFAGKQLAIISALIMMLLSLGYLIKAWNLVYSPRGVVFGAGYTDVKISLLFYKIIAVVSLIAAIVVFISVLASKAKPIVISIIVIIVLIIGESITSIAVENFIVKSNQKTLEQPYITRNIDYTRKAFNIDKIEEKEFPVKDAATKEDITSNKDTINNIKINSFEPALEFYNQVQVIRYYYGFNDIDVDRYNINGKYTQVFVAPREINLQSLQGNASTWQNKHLIYTHGYGLVMSKVNSVTSQGQPDFVMKDIPTENDTNIPLSDPRIYFGEKTDDYAIVDTNIKEFDYPKGGDNQWNKYDGKAGIKLGLVNKVLFAINERNMNFLLSRDITSDSKILINRNIMDRVTKIAPFLQYDKDPYIAVSNGKLYWIIDAYTTSDRYPYSQPQNGINYIRNSVKVVVDATNGDTNFYIVDKNDPIVMSYSKIFPGLFKDVNTLSEDLRSHFRYPEDLFNTQCDVISKYHMTDPGVFYNAEDLWQVSQNQKKVEGDKANNEGSYVVMRLPGSNDEQMLLLNYFNMVNKDNMVSLLGVSMDKDDYGKMVLYKFPPDKTIAGPVMFKQKYNQDPNISKEISLWNTEGSGLVYGDTMIIPINNTLMYVEPIYLRASGKNSIPEMKRVIVSLGDKIVLADSIDSALNQLFNDGTNQNNAQVNQNQNTNINTNQNIPSDAKEKLKDVKTLFDSAIEAQKNGDWSKYGEYIKQIQDILNNLNK